MTSATAERARLAALARYDVTAGDVPVELSALCELAARICDTPGAAVNLIDEAKQHQVAALGADPSVCDREDSMCAITVAANTDLVVADASTDPRFAANPWVDGRLGTVRFYAGTLLRAPGGEPVGTLCVFDERPRVLTEERRRGLRFLAAQVVDVLELRVQRRLLRDALDELSRSHEYLAAFAGQISHDLKTPLTACLGFLELLADLPLVQQDPEAVEYVQRCESSSRRMFDLIEELLAYARVGGTLHRNPVELDDLLPQVLDDLGETAGRGSVTWSGPALVGDPAQLRALLQNLVGNALTYQRAGVPGEVTVHTVGVGDTIQLQVVDNGPGIPAERRRDVLAPLTRLRPEIPGTGLGLATCHRIVAAHGGTLSIGASANGGTTVTVLLPR